MAEKDLDTTGLFGEFRRMVRTTGTVGGIAARMAGHRLGLKRDGAAHAEDLKATRGGHQAVAYHNLKLPTIHPV